MSAQRNKRNSRKKDYHWGDIITSTSVDEIDSKQTDGTFHAKRWNIIFLYLCVFVFFTAIILALFDLQIVRGQEFLSEAESNRIHEEEISADRGIMLDRNGKQLVMNEPSFHVILKVKNAPRMVPVEEWEKFNTLVYDDPETGKLKKNLPEKLPLPNLTDEGQEYFFTLAKILGAKEEDLITTFVEGVGINHEKEVTLKKDVSRDQQIQIKARKDEFPGIEIKEVSDREYPYKNLFTHVLGYTGEVNDADVQANSDVDLGDIIGKSGLERYYDDYVRGEKGVKLIEEDVKGKTVREFVSSETEPVPGDNLHLTLDLEVQKKLYEVLKEGVEEFDATGGTIILEEVETGEIVGMVSLPDYDPNLFVGGISYKDFNAINADPNKPQLNRAISATYPPGSTYKTIVGSAALQEGAIKENTYYTSTGVMYLGNQAFPEFAGKAWGRINLIDGLAYSSNHYFCHTMLDLGINKFVPYADWAGFGAKTGIDLNAEAEGIVPSPESKAALAVTRPWLESTWNDQGDDCNSAIGQGITTVTPIQMVNWAATIGNGGNVMQPHLVKKIVNHDGETVKEIGTGVVRDPKVSKKNLDSIKKGMRQTVERSIVYPLKGAKVNVAAKTGTAQFGARNSKGEYTKNHAWVITIFPYEKPKYSMVVFLEAGYASNNSAKVARKFIDWYVDYDKSGLKKIEN